MSKKEDRIGHEIEFLSHGQGSKITGECWWNYDRQKVEASDEGLLALLKQTKIGYEYKGETLMLSIDNGITFLDQLPSYFQGYTAARKKR